MMYKKVLSFLLLAITICCQQPLSEEITREPVISSDFFDLEDIQKSGEIIVSTLYGPETYYENHGYEGGDQFKIVQEFASYIGARVRIEIASDENELIQQLKSGETDMIAYNIKDKKQKDLIWSGDTISKKKTLWVTRQNSAKLSSEINVWFKNHKQQIQAIYLGSNQEGQPKKIKAHVKRKAIMKNPSKGIISDYDKYYKLYARGLGWDWKLLAAQSYQESGFDTNATSWAGARGLMQLMPTTAGQVGIKMSDIYQPEANISGGAKYLKLLNNQFKDIKNPTERIHFVLAAYNCGTLHVKDAQALAKKYGKNPQIWKGNVDEYILHLQESKYNHDPIVKYGYCRGSETYDYVNSIMNIYKQYITRVR